MPNGKQLLNPFAVQTPEDIASSDVVSLFVDVFTDFFNIPKVGHTFLHGPRGSGKSMMFRYLEPDCQCLALGKTVPDLPFFAVYISIKNTDLKLTELQRLENKHSALILNEHFLVVHIAVKLFGSLLKVPNTIEQNADTAAVTKFYDVDLKRLLRRAGWDSDLPEIPTSATLSECFSIIQELFNDQQGTVISYLRRLSFSEAPIAYSGPLCGYLDFLLPLIRGLKRLPLMPKGPVFLLLDDADNLNRTQTTILNSWVSCRTQADVSLKISTQMNYKTFLTATGQTIDSPHDFSEVNISAVYTSLKSKYFDRVSEIVSRRLKIHDLDRTPDEFFPAYDEQEQKIRDIGSKIRSEWEDSGRGHRPSDDVVRYARPDYIASLQGIHKSGSTYKYAGFEQLVHLSSGIVRYFLESASLMYGEMQSAAGGEVLQIDPDVQDRVVRQQASAFLFSEFDRWSADEGDDDRALNNTRKLRNLIRALGGTFHQILLSDAAERRVFSIALSEDPYPDILEVLKLGVRYGYFHQSTIGNKEGTGRTRMYILNRRLAPVFTLDPTSFAGYKFVTNSILREAMEKPNTFVGRVKRNGVNDVFDTSQLTLFEGGDEA